MTDTDDDGFDLGMPYQPDPDEEAYYARREQFVRTWREAHPDDVYGAFWACDLCGKVIQIGAMDPTHDSFVQVLAEKHQRFHCDDWLDLMALAAAPEAGATGDEAG